IPVGRKGLFLLIVLYAETCAYIFRKSERIQTEVTEKKEHLNTRDIFAKIDFSRLCRGRSKQ
ncbi:hypothetical protein KY349_05185, partial [Candidatus Woesearchaeota archaeon]|nr:hypothetical protein [Candidatus Woesearchaeota archaeon]